MTSISQENLLKLALADEAKANFAAAIQNLEEALNFGHSDEIVVKLCQLYRKIGKEDQAYTLIKEEPDLFSNKEVHTEYLKILAANHYFIEALQLERITREKLPFLIEPVISTEQTEIIKKFQTKKQITQFDYQQLFKLDLLQFQTFVESILLNPESDFALRLALCEDLVKLKIKDKVKVWVLGEVKIFIPENTILLEKSPIYQEIISGIGDRFKNNPSQLPLMLGEFNLVLGSLYPFLPDFIDDPDAFVKDLLVYLKTQKGGSHQALISKIYKYLPK